MSGQKGNDKAGQSGRHSDIQARQTDDGSFELVVEDGDESASAERSPSKILSQSKSESTSDEPRRPGRVVLIGVLVVAVIGLGIFFFSADDEPAPERAQAEEAQGFSPYKEGPAEEKNAAGVKPAIPDKAPSAQPEPEEPQEAAFDEQVIEEGDEEGWAIEEDSEVIVVEDEYDDSLDDEEADEPEQVEREQLERPRIEDMRKKSVGVPLNPHHIQPIPAQKLEKLRPKLKEQPGRVDGERGNFDGQDEYPDEDGYADEEPMPDGTHDDEYYPEEGEPEYDPEDERWDEYNEGY